MQTYRLPQDTAVIPATDRVIALGLFDGVHIGHRAVIAEAVRVGSGRCAIFTFSPATLYTKGELHCICSEEEQNALLAAMGVTEVFEADFASVCNLSPAQFVQTVLRDTLHATAITCGFNYHFGKGGIGDTALLKDLCAPLGITVTIVPAVMSDGDTVSSTAIRAALADGDMATARRMLNRAYCLSLPVEQGQHLGRKLGMPTINQPLPTDLALPRFGVYASCVEIDQHTYTGVTNIGIRPTVGAAVPLAETWIADFDGDVYGKTVKVFPLAFLREECAFDSLEKLRNQVARDAVDAHNVFTADEHTPIRAVLFDFDDTLHLRDAAFVTACHRFVTRYYPMLDKAEHDNRVAEMIAFDDFGYRRPLAYPQFIERYLTLWGDAACPSPEDALNAFFCDFATASIPLTGVTDTLRSLRERGYKLGIITNGYTFLQNHKLDFSGLRPLLDITVVSGDEGVHKPDAELFRRTAARLGLPCEACMYVGDYPANDIQGALAANMTAVHIDYGFPANHPIYEAPIPSSVTGISHLEELLKLPDLTFCPK